MGPRRLSFSAEQPPSRVLVIPLRFIGDAVLSVPLLRALRVAWPDTHLAVLASAPGAELLRPCPWLDSVLVEPKGNSARVKQLQAGHFDLAISLRKSWTLPALCRLAGIPHVMGFDKQRFPWGFRRAGWWVEPALPFPSLNTDLPHSEHLLAFAEALGLPPADRRLELWTLPADDALAERLLARQGPPPYAAVHLSSPSVGKSLSPALFGPVLADLHERGYTILALGAANDAPGHRALAEAAGVPVHSLAGATTLRQTVALLRQTSVYVGIDSGPLHLAAAAGVPAILGVYGPTNHRQWGAQGTQARFEAVYQPLPCRPCHPQVCAHNACRTTLEPQQVAVALSRLLQAEVPT